MTRSNPWIFWIILPILNISLSAWADSHFTGKFSAEQQTHTSTGTGSGTAAVVLTEDGAWFYITVEGLTGPITAAHFHHAPMGADGPVVRNIGTEFSGNTATGLWSAFDNEPLTDSLIQELFSGNLYINIHTAMNPPGELRAQVIPSSGAGFNAHLTPEQETHSVTSSGKGSASFTLTDDGLQFLISMDGLSGAVTAAHFHRGAMGADGPVARTITNDFISATTAAGLWRPTDSEPLDSTVLNELLAGDLYLNIHTAMNPPGEIRGQVLLSGGFGMTARLDTAQQNHPVTTNASGSAALTVSEMGVVFRLTVEGLSGPVTAAHIHQGAPGSNGPVVRTITSDFNGSTAAGIWGGDDPEPFDEFLATELINGNLYFNIHTAANPMGEVRGQILLNPATSLSAALTPEQETHSVTSGAAGTANLTLTDAGVEFHVTVEDLSMPITGAHFHQGAAGTDGPVVRTLTTDFSGNTASGIWTANDTEPLTPALIGDLLAGNLYFNIHTSANPPGEVRGQVFLNGGTNLGTILTPEQETHVSTSSGIGAGSLVLTDDGVLFNLTVENLTGAITGAHIHNGAAGTDGPVVRTISSDFSGNTAVSVWTADDSEPLTDSLLADLLAGNLYFNIHTSANPPGEIRGQIFLRSGLGMASRLEPGQEVHNVTSSASGTSALTLTDAGLVFNLTMDELSGPVNAAHFHNAPRGTNGPVVRTITGDLQGNTGFGVWQEIDAEPITTSLIGELIQRNIYYNIHTAANPMGEIRGQVEPFEFITGLEPVDAGGVIPEQFRLSQNYPNPFNPATTVEFALAKSALARLIVFNVLGQKVAELLNERLDAGVYQFQFDASGLASGIYYYRLEADRFSQTRKMLLLK